MFRTIDDFVKAYSQEKTNTQKILDALTDDSLKKAVGDGHRTLGRMAWHIVTTYPEMTATTGIVIGGVDANAPAPGSAKEIAKAYATVSQDLLTYVKMHWTDKKLSEEMNFYGQMWTLGKMLYICIVHEVHHRGQMTVLMRQAGLKVPGVYGPALEEWSAYGQPVPEV